AAGIVVTLLVTSFALFGLIGNSALSASSSARSDHNWAKAASQARKARHLLPWSPDPWTALGSAQYSSGDVQGARKSFRTAVAKDPGEWTLWFKLAAVTHGKERKEAIAQVRRLNPLGGEIKKLSSRSG